MIRVLFAAVVVINTFSTHLAQAQQENTTLMGLKPASGRSLEKEREPEKPSPIPKESESSAQVSAVMPAKTKKPPEKAGIRAVYTVRDEGARSGGNLPFYAKRRDEATLQTQDNIIKVAKEVKKTSPLELGRGDIVQARISQDLIGYEDAQSPVRAVITRGPYKGAWLIGNATMDKKTKSILVRFSTFRSEALEAPIEATVHSVTGELGLKGEFNSHYWNYFWAEVLASGVSGYANAFTERKRNIFGYADIVPTPESAAHQAVATAAEKTSEKFAERAREAPEFTVVRGPAEVQVFITKGPTEF